MNVTRAPISNAFTIAPTSPRVLFPRLAANSPQTMPTGADMKIRKKAKDPISEIGIMATLIMPSRLPFDVCFMILL